MHAWEVFLSALEKELGKAPVDMWLRPLKVVHFDACNLYLETQNAFQITWFEQHVKHLAATSFLNNNHHPIKIHFTNAFKKKIESSKIQTTAALELELKSDAIDPTHTFDNFIEEDTSLSILPFFKEISLGKYNPLFIYGPSGSGKTHLLGATAEALRAKNLRVFFVHAETFTQHAVKAMRSSKMQEFRNIYRNQDVLIIDDIQTFARKTATQEELFHTFNALHMRGKQLILSSMCPPNLLEGIEPRLTSRFEWGIALHLCPLSPDKLINVLRLRAKTLQFPLTEEHIAFLLETFASSAKATLRGFEALFIRYQHTTPPSLEEVSLLLKDLMLVEKDQKLTPEKILSSVSSYFGIRSSDILGKSQAREYVEPRRLAMYLCRYKLQMSYLALGRFFGRDHSTVISGIRQVEEKKQFQETSFLLEELIKELSKENNLH